ncbi:MAG: hypothetical protein ACXABY_16215 [Candidatus Thorarchaeota archaeon]|jgi:hypothetical protein
MADQDITVTLTNTIGLGMAQPYTMASTSLAVVVGISMRVTNQGFGSFLLGTGVLFSVNKQRLQHSQNAVADVVTTSNPVIIPEPPTPVVDVTALGLIDTSFSDRVGRGELAGHIMAGLIERSMRKKDPTNFDSGSRSDWSQIILEQLDKTRGRYVLNLMANRYHMVAEDRTRRKNSVPRIPNNQDLDAIL